MARSFYTVSFLHTDGTRQVSRFFTTKRAALKWAKWMLTQAWVAETFVHEGREGGNLLEVA